MRKDLVEIFKNDSGNPVGMLVCKQVGNQVIVAYYYKGSCFDGNVTFQECLKDIQKNTNKKDKIVFTKSSDYWDIGFKNHYISKIKEHFHKLFEEENKVVVHDYIKDNEIVEYLLDKKGNPVGMLLASNIPGNIFISWSKVNTKAGDKFNEVVARELCFRKFNESPEGKWKYTNSPYFCCEDKFPNNFNRVKEKFIKKVNSHFLKQPVKYTYTISFWQQSKYLDINTGDFCITRFDGKNYDFYNLNTKKWDYNAKYCWFPFTRYQEALQKIGIKTEDVVIKI